MENNLQNFFTSKKLLVLAGGLIVVLLILISLVTTANKPSVQNDSIPQSSGQVQPQNQPGSFFKNQEAMLPEVKQAIEEQKQADQEYSNWQQSNSDAYSWIRKLPLTAVNYFVYFDLNKKVFIGRLYPESGENIDQIKSDVLNRLKTEKEIPVENFKFEWNVFPK